MKMRRKTGSRWRQLARAAALTVAVASSMRSLRRIDLRKKVVVITGGGRGLGFAIARAFALRGCRLALCGRDADEVAAAVAELQRMGVEAFGAGCDASKPDEVQKLVGDVVARFGTIDILINNAGQSFVGPAVELRTETVEDALRNIFWVQYHPTMAVLPLMRKRHFGRIVHVTSFGGKIPLPHQAAYNAGKFAATGWSETMAAELAKEGIIVSTIVPPPLKDGAPLHVHFGGLVEDEFRWFAEALTSPVTATSAERTAEVIVDAVLYGDAERTVSLASWLLIRAYGLAPNLLLRLLAALDRRLPPPGPPGTTSSTLLGKEVAEASEDAIVQELAAAARKDEERYRPTEPPRDR